MLISLKIGCKRLDISKARVPKQKSPILPEHLLSYLILQDHLQLFPTFVMSLYV